CRAWALQRSPPKRISRSANGSTSDLGDRGRARARAGVCGSAELGVLRTAWCRLGAAAAVGATARALARNALRQQALGGRLLHRDRRVGAVRRRTDARAAVARAGVLGRWARSP